MLLGAAAMGAASGVAAQAAKAQERGQLLDALVRLETQSWQDTKDRNYSAMAAYLADEGQLIFYDGSRFAKAAFLAFMKDFRIESFVVADPELLVVGPDAATLLYRCTYASATKNEKAATATVAASNCYVRRGGRWLSLLYQETQIET